MFKNKGKFQKNKGSFNHNTSKAKEWGKVKFVPKVPKGHATERISTNTATPWKTFKDELVEKQREEETSNTIDMNSAEARETLKKREQNYRRMMITEQSKQATKWENFEDGESENASSSKQNTKNLAENLVKSMDLENFNAKNLNFKQNNIIRRMLTKGITQRDGHLNRAIKDLRHQKKSKKNKNKQEKS